MEDESRDKQTRDQERQDEEKTRRDYGRQGGGYREDRDYAPGISSGYQRDYVYGSNNKGRGGERDRGLTPGQDRGRGGSEGAPSGRYAGRGPKHYQRTDDRIAEEVNDRLMLDGEVDATNIEVLVRDGEVTLEGFVEDADQQRAAEACAYGVGGVRGVQSRLRVQQGLLGQMAQQPTQHAQQQREETTGLSPEKKRTDRD